MSDGNALSAPPLPHWGRRDGNRRRGQQWTPGPAWQGRAGQPVLLTNKGTKNYFWQDVRPRANEQGEVSVSQHRKASDASTISKRMNSYGIGGEMEARAGLLYQKQVIAAPSVHFGLGEYPTLDVLRILWPNGDVRGEFEIKGDAIVRAEHRLNVSCPFLFTWNGDRMEFVTDCIWRSPLGLRINAQDTAGVAHDRGLDQDSGRSARGEVNKGKREKGKGKRRGFLLPPSRSSVPESVYDLRVTAELWETHFFDHISLLLAVDHPGRHRHLGATSGSPSRRRPMQVYVTGNLKPIAHAVSTDVGDDSDLDITDIVRCRDGPLPRHTFGQAASIRA